MSAPEQSGVVKEHTPYHLFTLLLIIAVFVLAILGRIEHGLTMKVMKKTNEDLRQANEALRRVIEKMDRPITEQDLRGPFIWTNMPPITNLHTPK